MKSDSPLARLLLEIGERLGIQALAAEAVEEIASTTGSNDPYVHLERCESGYRTCGPVRADYATAMADTRALRSALTPAMHIVSPPFVIDDDEEG